MKTVLAMVLAIALGGSGCSRKEDAIADGGSVDAAIDCGDTVGGFADFGVCVPSTRKLCGMDCPCGFPYTELCMPVPLPGGACRFPGLTCDYGTFEVTCSCDRVPHCSGLSSCPMEYRRDLAVANDGG